MNLIFIIGPPAVGKMTVGQSLAKQLDYELLHNHHSIEFALEFFEYGSPEFRKVNREVRNLMFETFAQSKNTKGLIHTLVMTFDLQEDWDYLDRIKAKFQPYGWNFYFVELSAPLVKRLERNKTPNRLHHKPSKRDIAASEKRIINNDKRYRLTSKEDEFKEKNYLKIDTTLKSIEETASLILATFGIK